MKTLFKNNPEHLRYELLVDGVLSGIAEYRLADPHEIMFVCTQVRPEYRGRGLARSLVRYALDDVRSSSCTAVPACPYVAEFLRRHHEYADLVRPELRKPFRV